MGLKLTLSGETHIPRGLPLLFMGILKRAWRRKGCLGC
jgi:hypothetical protein